MRKCMDCGCAIDDEGQCICNNCHIKRYSAPKPGASVACVRCGKSFIWKGVGTTGQFDSTKKKCYCSDRCLREDEEDERRSHEVDVGPDDSIASPFEYSSSSSSYSSASYSSPSSSRSYASSSSSSPKSEALQAVGGLLILIAICWGGYRGFKWLFSGSAPVVTEAELMEKWQEHIEQRRKAFSDGLSENAAEAKGLVNYTWEEWQNRQKGKQSDSAGKTNAEVIGDKAKEIWQDVSTKGVKEIGDKAKSLWKNITSKAEKDPEEELKRLNARLAELEGRGANGGQQNAAEPKTEKKSSSYNVTRKGDEAIVTVTSERESREDAWQSAYRMAVKGAVSVFVRNPKLLMDNNDRFEERLNTVSMRDIKRYEPIKDMQQGDVFTVQIKAWVEKETLARKFKDIFPDAFVGAGARKQASKNLTND